MSDLFDILVFGTLLSGVLTLLAWLADDTK